MIVADRMGQAAHSTGGVQVRARFGPRARTGMDAPGATCILDRQSQRALCQPSDGATSAAMRSSALTI